MYIVKKYWREIILIFLITGVSFSLYVFFQERPTDYTKIAFLNIGQGDAIYIESPTHKKIMIDGGPPHAVLSKIREVMPFYDHTLDMLVVTNPDQDHIAGFIDLIHNYKIGEVLEPGTHNDSEIYKTLEQEIISHHIKDELARRGMHIDLGGGAILEILFPDRDVSTLATNDGSIIAKLIYKNNSVMLTGDAPSSTEEYVESLDPREMKSTILKAGHHGSRTSASESFIETVNPQYAVISAGFYNKYGHPHKETVDLLNKFHIPMLITYEKGTVVMKLLGDAINVDYIK